MVSVLLRWAEGKCHPFPGNRDDIARKHFTARTKPHSSRQISPNMHLLLCSLECGETHIPERVNRFAVSDFAKCRQFRISPQEGLGLGREPDSECLTSFLSPPVPDAPAQSDEGTAGW